MKMCHFTFAALQKLLQCPNFKVEKSLKQKAVFFGYTTRSTIDFHQITIYFKNYDYFFVDSFICIKSFIIGLRLTVTAYWRKLTKCIYQDPFTGRDAVAKEIWSDSIIINHICRENNTKRKSSTSRISFLMIFWWDLS